MIATLATKAELKSEKDKTGKLKAFDSGYFSGKSHFDDDNDGMHNYLVFQPVYKFFIKISKRDHILAFKSKELSVESIKPPSACNISLAPTLNFADFWPRVKFDSHCLK